MTETPEVKSKGKKKVAKVEEKKGIFITVEGQYFSKTVSHCIPKQYKIELQLTDDPTCELLHHKKIHYLAFRKLVPNYFRTRPHEYPDYGGIRTCFLVDVQVLGSGKKKSKKSNAIEDMSMNELVKFAAREDLIINPKDCATIQDARKGVADEMENRKLAEFDLEQAEQEEKASNDAKNEEFKDILKFNNIE